VTQGESGERRAELGANLAEVRLRIAAAAAAAGRDPDDVTLVVVTKTWPASDVALLAELGVTDVGENRDQEAAPKAAALPDLLPAGVVGPAWHFVGQLQTNKVRSVVTYADVVESVDRLRLVTALDRAASAAGRQLRCLVQVSLATDPAAGRGGASPADVPAIADALAAAASLELAGLMAVAPLGEDPDAAFGRLGEVAGRLRSAHPHARVLSAGMTEDLEAGVRHGATQVRVGRAVLGHRPPVG
jgi:PLP dependent protein